MGVRFACHSCGKRLNIKTELAGRRGICPACSTRFRIPLQDTEVSAPIDPSDTPNSLDSAESLIETTAIGVATATRRRARSVASDPRVASQAEFGSARRDESHSATPASLSRPASQLRVSDRNSVAHSSAQPMPADLPSLLGGTTAVWYVRPPSGGQYGPADGPTMGQWIAEGRVADTAMLWRDGWPDWRIAKEFLPRNGSPHPSPPTPRPLAPSLAEAPAPTTPISPSPTEQPASGLAASEPLAAGSPIGSQPSVAAQPANEVPDLKVSGSPKILDTNKKKRSRKRIVISIALGCVFLALAAALVMVLLKSSGTVGW